MAKDTARRQVALGKISTPLDAQKERKQDGQGPTVAGDGIYIGGIVYVGREPGTVISRIKLADGTEIQLGKGKLFGSYFLKDISFWPSR